MSASALLICQSWVVASAALLPALIGTHPLLLEAVQGSLVSVAAAAASAPGHGYSPCLPVVASLPFWLVTNSASWWAGRRLGPRLVVTLLHRRPESGAALVARCERLVDRGGFAAVACGVLIPVPTAVIHASCGWRRMPLPTFLLADSLGVLARNAVFTVLGRRYRTSALALTRTISHDETVTTAAILALLAIILILRQRRRSGRRKAARG